MRGGEGVIQSQSYCVKSLRSQKSQPMVRRAASDVEAAGHCGERSVHRGRESAQPRPGKKDVRERASGRTARPLSFQAEAQTIV